MPAPLAPVHWAAGSDGETNFGTTSLAAPHAVSSRVPDTPSLRGWTSPDRDPCANPDLRSSVAYWLGRNQARIDGKAFTTNQTGRDARLDNPLEQATKNISLAKTLVAGARKNAE